METPKHRRWFRFSLSTLFVAVLLLSIASYWFSANWRIVQERLDVLLWLQSHQGWTITDPGYRERGTYPLPAGQTAGLLWVRRVFGDREVMAIGLPKRTLSQQEIDRVKKAFPEAVICWFPVPPATH